MILQDGYCEKCGEKYTITANRWCKPCQLNNLKISTNWTGGNEKIDNLIQEMQLKIISYNDLVFEWIPYNQFKDIKEASKGIFTVYSAIWKDGPLHYNDYEEYTRQPDKKVAFKCLHNSQNITEEYLNEV